MNTNILRILGLLAIGSVSGCSEWSSRPARVDAHFGEAVREMRTAQTYDPATREHPNPNPILRRDGRKSQQVLDTTYRQDVWQMDLKRKDTDHTPFRPDR